MKQKLKLKLQWLTFQLADGVWQDRELLDKSTVLTMRSPQISMPIPYPVETVPGAHFLGYGLAWFLHDYEGTKVVEHGGNIDGMTALVAMIPEKKSGLVMLSNMGTTRLREVLMYYCFDRILDRPEVDWNPHFVAIEEKSARERQAATEAKIKNRVPDTSLTLAPAAYAGTYHSDQMGDLTISLKNKRLMLTFQERTVLLVHWHYDTFRLPDWNIEEPGVYLVNFIAGPDGTVVSLRDDSLGEFRKIS